MALTTMETSFKACYLEDFEKHALQILPSCVKKYYNSGDGEQFTIKWNREAFRQYRILPRMLRNVSQRDISTTVLGERVSMPIGISPTAFHKLAHPNGERGTARAAASAKTLYVLSMYSNTPMREVVESSPRGLKWMQVIISKDRDFTRHMVRRAEEFGHKALVVIVDQPSYGKNKQDGLKDVVERYDCSVPIMEEYILSKKEVSEKYSNDVNAFLNDMLDDSLTWQDISWLKSITKLPVVLKGILSAEDAKLGVQHGASAIWVSNHGGRQLDSEPATIEVLPDIVKAVGHMVEVYMDGGITRGTDVFKALALGARMVFLGKPMLWSLACDGERGTSRALEILNQELTNVFSLTGCSSVNDVTKEMIVSESYYLRSTKSKI